MPDPVFSFDAYKIRFKEIEDFIDLSLLLKAHVLLSNFLFSMTSMLVNLVDDKYKIPLP